MKPSLRRTYHQEQVDFKQLDTHLIKRLWRYLVPYRGWIFLAILFLIFARGIEAVVPIMIGKMTQQILDHAEGSEKQIILSSILHEGLLIGGFLCFGYILDASNIFLKSWVGQRALFKLRMDVFDHIQNLPLQVYDQNSVGRLMTRTIHDVDQINQMFAESIVPIIGNLILFASMCVGIMILNWRIGIVLIFMLPVVFWMTNHFRYYQRQCYNMVRSIISAMNTFVQEHLMGVFTIRSFGLLKKEKQQFDDLNEDFCTIYQESIYNFSRFIAGIDFMQSLSMILVFLVLVYFSPEENGFQAGTFLTFSLYAIMFFRPLTDLAERYNVLQSAMAASERIFDIMNQKEEPITEKNGASLTEVNSIAFEDVWFAYEKEDWILKGLSFEIKKGESLAVIGITGAGKTTIMSLLLRFYDYQKGHIKINGRDVRDYALNDLRRQFSVVLQDPVIFSGALLDNISLYDKKISQEKFVKPLII